MKPRILLMEDKVDFRTTLAMNLKLEGYLVKEAGSGMEALDLFDAEHFDLCLLDVMVPGVDGLQVCERIRVKNQKTPIVFLSAMSMSQDRINGLRSGADDYIAKPFHLEELLMKLDRNLKKNYWMTETHKPGVQEGNVQVFGDNQVDLSAYEAKGIDGTFTLTRKEAELLSLFFSHPNEILSRERILNAVWGYSVYPNTRSVDNFILFLRQKFEPDPKNPRFFKAVRGAGYRFTPDG